MLNNMVSKKVYRVSITLGEYESDGFWDVKGTSEMAQDKKQLKESLKKLFDSCNIYIDDRLI